MLFLEFINNNCYDLSLIYVSDNGMAKCFKSSYESMNNIILPIFPYLSISILPYSTLILTIYYISKLNHFNIKYRIKNTIIILKIKKYEIYLTK
jgi:hypothetical protein